MQRIVFSLLLLTLSWSLSARVVLIHGFMSDGDDMVPIQRQLRCCGLESCIWEYPSKEYTFQCHAARLVEALQKLACECPDEPIHFVAHSSGALVLRCALNSEGCPEEAKVGRAVLLAPPNKGSSLARQFKGNAMVRWTMGNQSGWQLMNLQPCDIPQCFGSFPETMQIFVLSGDKGINMFFQGQQNDEWLAVWETTLETPYWGQTLHLTHSQLLKKNPSLSLIANFLTCAVPSEDSDSE